jgi:hypothetical protein
MKIAILFLFMGIMLCFAEPNPASRLADLFPGTWSVSGSSNSSDSVTGLMILSGFAIVTIIITACILCAVPNEKKIVQLKSKKE